MNKNVLIFLALFLSALVFAQVEKKKITLKISDLSKKEIFLLLEEQTDYHFFFLDKWLDKKTLSVDFKEESIQFVLNTILQETNVNYFILDEKNIVLTNGSLIQDNLKKEKGNTQQSSSILVNAPLNDFKGIIKIGREEASKLDFYTVSGQIKNEKTDKPVEGVTIFEKKKNIYTITDKNGNYKIKLPYGENDLETSFVGFNGEFKRLIVYNNGNLSFVINEKDEELDEVVVNANKSRNVRQTIAGITNIKVKDIKTIPTILGERDILKVAITLPSVKSAGEGSEGVNIRGGKVDQNLFLLDNGVIYNPTHFLGLFSAINPFTTSDLKIYAGNMPSEFGGRLSSVFDSKTNDPNTKKFTGEASIGPVTGNVNVDIPLVKEKSGLILGVRSTYSDWILNVVNNEEIQNSSVSFFDVIAKYKHTFNDKNSLKITGYYSEDAYQIASDTINKYGNRMFSVNWNHKLNDRHQGDLILSNSNYTFDIDYEKNNINNGFNLNYQINETDLKLKMDYKYSNTHRFNYGVESKLYNINPGTIKPNNTSSTIVPVSIQKERALENGLFFSDEITFDKKLNVNLGVRLNQYLGLGPSSQRIYEINSPKNQTTLLTTENYKTNEVFKSYYGLSYRFSSRYALDKSLSLKAGYNKSFQYIHRLNNNTTATPIDTWRLSDSNIKPQEGTQISLGVFKNIDDDNIELSLEGYYKEYENLLDYKIGANLLLNENIETEVIQGNGKSYGVEFLLKKNIGRFNGWLGYSYSRSLIQLNSMFDEERVNDGLFFPTNYDIPHDLNAVVNYKLTQRYSFSANFTYQTGKPITYPTGKYIVNDIEFLTYSNRNQFRIPDYYRLDIGVNIEGNHKIKKLAHSFWNFSIYNVLGRNNPYSVFFETVNGNVKSYQNSIFSVPIPTITYNFKF